MLTLNMNLMDRRNFTKTIGIATAGTIIVPQIVLSANTSDEDAVWFVPALVALGRFALGVGAGIIANTIYDYLKEDTSDRRVKEIVRSTNRTIKQEDNFRVSSKSKVYTEKNKSIFYPLVNDKQIVNGGSNVCIPVFNRNRQLVSKLEGPAIIGLGNICENNFGYNKRFDYVEYKNMFMPIRPECICNVIERCDDGGYRNVMSYKTKDGVVKIDYWTPPNCTPNPSKKTKYVNVLASNDKYRKNFIRDYPIEYLA